MKPIPAIAVCLLCSSQAQSLPETFEIPASPPGMRFMDSAYQAGRFYFLFTKAGASELAATDAQGRLLARKSTEHPALHLYPGCTWAGVLASRPGPNGSTRLERYAADLTFVGKMDIAEGFTNGFCWPDGIAGLGPGTLVSIDAGSGRVKSRTLTAAGDEPFVMVQGGPDSLLLVRQFTGLLQRVGVDGKVRRETLLTGPELSTLRAGRSENEGLFAPSAASAEGGLYVMLGHSSPQSGLRVQKYDFDGQFQREWRLPLPSFGGRPLVTGQLFVDGQSAFLTDPKNLRVVRYALSVH